MHLGLKIKIARIGKSLTQEQLAEKINKTRPLISSIEQTGKVNHYTLKKICKVLNLDINALENSSAEPELSYNTPNQNDLENRLNQMTLELSYLKNLVESQKDLISSLKGQINLMQKEKQK
jgi:transcriptional regulator with XRE-family HTH domain